MLEKQIAKNSLETNRRPWEAQNIIILHRHKYWWDTCPPPPVTGKRGQDTFGIYEINKFGISKTRTLQINSD